MRLILSLLLCLLAVAAFAQHTDWTQDANCVGAWLMRGPSGTGEIDYSGEGNHLSAVYDYIFSTYYPSGAGFTIREDSTASGYSGTSRWNQSGCLTLGEDGGSLDISGANATVSVVGWVKCTAAPPNTYIVPIACKYSTGDAQRQYGLFLVGSGSSQFGFRGAVSTSAASGGGYVGVTSTATNYAEDTWYHVAFVSNDTDLRVYVNGSLACTPIAHTAGIFNGSSYFTISRVNYPASTSNVNALYGFVDEVAVFNDELTAAEVDSIYQFGIDGTNGASDGPLFTAYDDNVIAVPSAATIYEVIRDSVTAVCNRTGWDKDSIGFSGMGIRAIDRVLIDPGVYGLTIMADGTIHGYERPPSVGMLALMHWLEDSASIVFPCVRWGIVPMVNPDGATLNTRQNNDTLADPDRKVDLNRNFETLWWDTSCTNFAFSTDTTTSTHYRGPYPFSEPESQAQRIVFAEIEPDFCFNVHTDQNKVWIPGDTCEATGFLYFEYTTPPDATSSFVEFINDSLIANGFEPFATGGTRPDTAIVIDCCGWEMLYADSLYGPAMTYEFGHGTCEGDTEEVNRLICTIKSVVYLLGGDTLLPPADIAVDSTTCNQATLTWTENANSDSTMILYDGDSLTTVESGTVTYLHESINGEHSWSLIAYYPAGTSDTSDAVVKTIELCAPTLDTLYDFNGDCTAESLEWSEDPLMDSIMVYRSDNGGEYVLLYTVADGFGGWIDELVTDCNSYNYKLKAKNDAGTSDFSNALEINLSCGKCDDTMKEYRNPYRGSYINPFGGRYR